MKLLRIGDRIINLDRVSVVDLNYDRIDVGINRKVGVLFQFQGFSHIFFDADEGQVIRDWFGGLGITDLGRDYRIITR